MVKKYGVPACEEDQFLPSVTFHQLNDCLWQQQAWAILQFVHEKMIERRGLLEALISRPICTATDYGLGLFEVFAPLDMNFVCVKRAVVVCQLSDGFLTKET